jgi:hypothetical protein
MNDGYVYVVAFSHGTVKVGQTANIGSRISTHKCNARSFGVTVTDWWASPVHAEWQQNEEALKVIARNLGGTPTSPEYFTGVDFAALVNEAGKLPFTVPQFPSAGSQPRHTVRLRIPDFMKLTEAQGLMTNDEIGEHVGLDHSTISRLKHGGISAGPRIIAAFLASFPDRHFEDIFEIALEDAA